MGHIGQDLVGGLALLVREFEGKGTKERIHLGAVRDVCGRDDARLLDLLAAEQGQLQADQLVEGQAPAGALGLGETCREVDRAKGPALPHETQPGHDGGRYRVHDIGGILDGAGYDAAHPGGRDALPHRVHRHDAGMRGRIVGA